MKVTFFTREYANVSGGHNTWLCRLLPALRQRGVEARLLGFHLSPGEEFPTVRALRQAGFRCTTVSVEELRYTRQRVRWILDRLTEAPPDVFVVNSVFPAAYFAARWLREAGIATVGICHLGPGTVQHQGLLDEFVLGRAAYRVTALVCVSKWLEQAVLARRPNGLLVCCIPCGVPIPERVAKQPNGQLRLAYVGRLAVEKRIAEVTHALCRAVREVAGTEALIYGDGPERATVAQIVHAQGNGLPVRLVGFVDNDQILHHLLACHAVVLLSDQEGLGLSLLEGMACGVVPIGLRGAPGVGEYVLDDVTGLLVGDRGDQFVAAVRRLRDDPELWQRLARAARAKVQAHYAENACVDRWQALFHKLINSSGPRKPLRPRRLHLLPPVHPSLGWLDPRPHRELIRRVRRFVDRRL